MNTGAKPYFENFIHLLRTGLAPRASLFVAACVAVVLFNIMELLFPKLLQLFVDAIERKPLHILGVNLEIIYELHYGIYLIPAALLLFALLRWVFTYYRMILQTGLGQGALFDLRNRIYNTMQSLSFGYHDKNHSGTLISNVVEDVSYVTRFFEFGLFPLLESPAYVGGAFVYLAVVCWPAALVSASLYALCLLILVFYFTAGEQFFARTKQIFARLVQFFSENMEGHLVVRAFGQRTRQVDAFKDLARKLHSAMFKEVMITSVMNQTLVYCATFGIFIVLGVSIVLIRQYGWTFTKGELFLVYYLQASLVPRTRMLTRSFDFLMRMKITADRLAPLFQSREYLVDHGEAGLPHHGPGSLQMQRVSFAYTGQEHSIRDVSLQINAGETIGIVGESGAGKSTLALLLCRFYDPHAGRILLDGRDIRAYPVKQVRDQFALVFQETFLFSATVRENIAYGKPDATLEEIRDAARHAHINTWIERLPKGYATKVGERGVTISGGQRQRLSIARALLRRPRFLILDDCTSALDTRTEKAIQESLLALRETSTMIIIAHRFSSIAKAARVFVLDHGNVVEQGPPDELNQPGTAMARVLQSCGEQVV
ncbi:MAG: ATP-binding cassette domain-containing protein [Chitinivibrionales bacterium]|nr:ATP-binding cassette domain-containing protein [Chitinivibrionales bacterium]